MVQAAGYAIGVTYMSPVTYTSQIPEIDKSRHNNQIVPNYFGSGILMFYTKGYFFLV